MEVFSTIDLEQRLLSLSNYLKNLNVNRTKNLERLAEQKINCLAEVKAFRVDLNNFFDRIENEFCKEIAVLESFQRKAIQNVVEELINLEKDITELKVKLETLKDSDINSKTKTSLQELKNYVSTYESKIETLGKENGIKEIDLYMSVKPEVQTLSCRIKALGEVYVTYAPVEIEIDGKESFVPEKENGKFDEEQLSPDEEDETENEDEEQTMHIVPTRGYTEPEFVIKQEPNDPEFQLDQTVDETSENIDIQKESAQKVLLSPVMRELRPKPTATSSDSNIMPSCSTTFTTPSIPLKLTTINNVPTLIAATQPEGGLKGPFIQVQQFPKPDKIPLKLSSTTQPLNSNPIPVVFCQQPLVGSQSSVNSGPIILQSLPMNTNKNSLSKRPAVRPLCPLPAKRATSELTLTSICPIDDPSSAKKQDSETAVDDSNTPPIQTVKEETLSFDELMAETQKTLSDDQYRMSNFHKTAQVKNARRFNRISADNLQEMLDMDKESKSTKANTKWGVKMFQQSGTSLTSDSLENNSDYPITGGEKSFVQDIQNQQFQPDESSISIIKVKELDDHKPEEVTEGNELTLRATKRHVKLFEDFIRETYNDTSEMHCLEPNVLKNYLCSFFTNVRKQGGSDYDPMSLQPMLHSFDRNLKKNDYPKSLMEGKDFLDVRQMLKERLRKLRAAKGDNSCTTYLTEEQIEILYQKKLLGCSSPDSIVNTLLMHFTVDFGIKSVAQHRKLYWEDVSLKYDSRGNGYLELSRNLLKSYSGTYKNISATNNARCPISLYKLYKSLRPADACGKNDKFYLQSCSNFTTDGTNPWFKNKPIGLHKLGSIFKEIIKSPGKDAGKSSTDPSTSSNMYIVPVDQMQPSKFNQTAISCKVENIEQT